MQMRAANTAAMIVGMDMDGVITRMPQFFALLSRAVRSTGGKVHVISSRACSQDVMRHTETELRSLSVEYDSLFLIPDNPAHRLDCTHPELSGYDAYLWQKVAIAQDHKLQVFFEDDPKVVELFCRYAPDIGVWHIK